MPEVRFVISWPDGIRETCYSPSRVVTAYFEAGHTYQIDDFLRRSRAALSLASDRVREKYGSPCGRALGQLAHIERVATRFRGTRDARVSVLSFHS